MSKVVLATRGTSGIPEFAGSTWVRLQYFLGLRQLGLDCLWIDRLQRIDPLEHHHSLDYLHSRFRSLAYAFGFPDRYCIVYDGGKQYLGVDQATLERYLAKADLLINISGFLPPESPLCGIQRRAYVDVDPGFTQIWALQWDMGISRHNYFFSVGQNVGTDQFNIPTTVEWFPILPPVCLSEWPAAIDGNCRRFSTIADWRSSQDAFHEGEYFGGKRGEFVRLLRVPLESRQRLDVALTIHAKDHEDQGMLIGHGWNIHDPFLRASDIDSYREFIRFSRAEFSVAKAGYIKSNSGWISDRTACYLASGKPAIVQSTGLEGALPTGLGLLTFRNVEEAVSSIHSVNSSYLEHCYAARELAESQFSSDVVLGKMLSIVGL